VALPGDDRPGRPFGGAERGDASVLIDRFFLQAPTLTLGKPAPDAEALIVREGVLEAVAPHIAAETDLLGLARGSALLREEGLGVGLGTERTLLPRQLRLLLVLLHVHQTDGLGHRSSSTQRVSPGHGSAKRHGWNYRGVVALLSTLRLLFVRTGTHGK
jgi:hypothetical protein